MPHVQTKSCCVSDCRTEHARTPALERARAAHRTQAFIERQVHSGLWLQAQHRSKWARSQHAVMQHKKQCLEKCGRCGRSEPDLERAHRLLQRQPAMLPSVTAAKPAQSSRSGSRDEAADQNAKSHGREWFASTFTTHVASSKLRRRLRSDAIATTVK